MIYYVQGMSSIDQQLNALPDPSDYFKGLGVTQYALPCNILIFSRRDKKTLQQQALLTRSHQRCVLIFNSKTAATVHLNHLSLRFSPGQCLFIHPFQFHHYSHLEDERMLWTFCTFTAKETIWLEPLRNRICDTSRHVSSLHKTLLRQWLQCNRVNGQNDYDFELLQVILLHLLVQILQDHPVIPDMQQRNHPGGLLNKINRILSREHAHPLGIAEIATELGLSQSTLRLRFRRAAGIPLGRHIQNYRINRAMDLLQGTDLPIGQVASEAGFGSPAAFSRTFREKTGMNPLAFRQTHQGS